MTNIKRLRSEIQSDPLGRGYSTMTDQQVADDLNALQREVIDPVSSRGLLIWAGSNDRLKKVDAARSNSNMPLGVQNVCEVAMRLIERADVAYDPTNAEHASLLGALVAAGVIQQTDADALNAMGLHHTSRAKELNLLGASFEVGPAHVAQARA